MDNVQRKLKLKKKLNKIDISRAYVYCNDQSKEWTALRLTALTDYEDVIFKYGKISIDENEKDDNRLASSYSNVSTESPSNGANYESEEKQIEPDQVTHLINRNLKEKIKSNAQDLHFLPKTATLPGV